ncbi:MAG: hypothetical protein D6731_04260 [Planctomycetota bacterium]|nr:MAG: hypothetical protein D6731_04260 [Planctomycetota bacterium]
MKERTVDSGRVETILAALVLIAVVALFVRFQLLGGEAPTEPGPVETPAVGEPVAPDALPAR